MIIDKAIIRQCQYSPKLQTISVAFLTFLEKEILLKIVNASTTSKSIFQRAEIILNVDERKSKYFIMNRLKIRWQTVQKWVNRWIKYKSEFSKVNEDVEHLNHKLQKLILHCLKDAPRSGSPSKFLPEQLIQVMHLACTKPESINIPLSHWSSRTLAEQIMKMNIIPKISHERVAFFLKKAELKPHRSRYWLNSRTRNSIDYDERIKEICVLYKNAIALHKNGVHVISIDEKSGIQAIERANQNLPMRSNSPEKIEHEYVRHGTQCLIGNLEVATGKMIAPMVSDTRKEEDFLANIENLVSTDPNGEWIFVMDQLNTHKSESLVFWIASEIKFGEDLGKSGYHGNGILKSMNTRQKFLEDKTHRIRIQFTPKHCSWMNQIEIWFSGLSKRYLKRANFSSTSELKQGILDHIDYFNNYLAKPFKWTYAGKVLQK